MGLAVANYREHYGSYPPAFVAGPDGRPWHSWRVLLLPFMEYRELHAEYDFKEPWDGPNNSKLLQKAPRHYAFDGAPIGDGVANYLAVVGSETIWPGAAARKPEEIADSPDETILVVENRGADVKWTEPRDLALSAFNHRIFGPDAIDSAYD
ncbi:MAG TPA: DUF1559 domain-containing protein, partial [Planctomycetia bacterium]|nr:DUF1559 domain-containing protein [Planctomycetia bacterium]